MALLRAYANVADIAVLALLVLVGCAHESGSDIGVETTSTRGLHEVKNDGRTLLDRAAAKGDLIAVKSLIKAGAFIEPSEAQKATEESPGREDSALIFAATSENPKVVNFL